jgi:hypothetical protein
VPRSFNTAGPNDPSDHYTLPALARLPDVYRLIEKKRYFVLHAPRQVGKTTTLLTLGHELTAEGRYGAVLLTMEQGAPFGRDVGAAELAILDSWRGRAEARLPPDLLPPPWPSAPPGGRINAALRAWARAADLGLVRMDPAGGLVVANPIYREIIVRALTFTRERAIGDSHPSLSHAP